MLFPHPVKERLAHVIGKYFSTKEIVSVFGAANIQADVSLYAKWRITLNAFEKLSEPDEAIPHFLEAFSHPLNFKEPEMRSACIRELNKVLTYVDMELRATDKRTEIVSTGEPLVVASAPSSIKTSTDYIAEAITFFKDEYNKVKMPGLTYEYSIGENAKSQQTDQDYDVYAARLRAIERLHAAGFITEYTLEEEVENEGYYIWDYAFCKIDERQLTQPQEAPRATDASAAALTQKIVHEHTHRIENGADSIPFKMEITKIPELQVRNVEDTSIPKGKKRVHLPKFSPTDWGKVEWRFIDERNVLITADKKQVPSDYEALGFKDEKRDKPNTAWAMLLKLAENGGETHQLPTPIPNTIKQHKRQLADRLKAIFKNDTDPFYEPADTRTYRIKIALLPPQPAEHTRPFDDALTEDALR